MKQPFIQTSQHNHDAPAISRAKPYNQLIKDALAADKAIDTGADVYCSDDVHRWLERFARNGWAERPAPMKIIR